MASASQAGEGKLHHLATQRNSNQPVAEGGAEVIHHGHDQIEGEKQREEAMLQEEADGDLDLLAQAAGPDIPQDDRLPDVDLPPVESVGRKIRKDLGEDAIEKDLQPGGAGRLQRLDRLGLDVLDDLPEQPSQDPARVNPQGEHSGKRPQAHRKDQDQRPDDMGDGPQEVQGGFCADMIAAGLN